MHKLIGKVGDADVPDSFGWF